MTATIPSSGRAKPVQDAWARYMIGLYGGFIGDTRGLAGTTLSDGVAGALADATAAAADAASALTLANNAQTTADGKNTVMYATSAPTVHPDGSALIDGDLWYKTSAGNIIGVYQRASGAWALLPIANDAIFANIDAGKITVGTLSGINLIGNFIETQANVGTGSSPSVVTGVLLNSSGNFYCYANTGPVLAFNASTGQLTVVGPIVSGGTITGATFQTASSGTRVVIDSSSDVDKIKFYSGATQMGQITVSSAGISIGTATGPSDITLKEGATYPVAVTSSNTNFSGTVNVGNNLNMNSGNITNCGTISGPATINTPSITNPTISSGGSWGGTPTFGAGLTLGSQMNTAGNNIGGNPVFSGGLVIGSSEVIKYNAPGTMGSGGSGAGPLLRVNTTSGNIIQDSSSRRYKQNIVDLKADDFEKLLTIIPKRFRYKETVKEQGQSCRYEWGFIAEDFADAGLDELVMYDAEGQPAGLAYDRITAALLGLLKDHRGRIEKIEKGKAK